MKTLKLLTITAVLGLAVSAQALEINGNITFKGGVIFDSTSLGSATQVNTWVAPTVESRDGDFATYVAVGAPVTFVAPYPFPSGAINSLWQAGGFSFDLTSAVVDYQSNLGLVVSGKGIISGYQFTPTAGTWTFTSQTPAANGVFSFSAASGTVPDGGVTAMLIGGALAGLAFVRRKLA